MAYTIPTFEAIRTDYLRDVRNLCETADITPDSDNFVRACGVSSAADGLYHHQLWISRQILPDTADAEYIEQHAALRGLALKQATKAAGVLVLAPLESPVPAFPAGLVSVHKPEDGPELLTATVQAWAGGEVPPEGIALLCEAVVAGAAPQLNAETVTLQMPPTGIDGGASLTLTGGTDTETYTELLARLLYYMRNPPGGGRAQDYVRWAMEVSGVTWAKCYPMRRGVGTVDVVFTSGGNVPPAVLVAKVQAHIDLQRPVTCPDCTVFAPVESLVDIAASVRLDSAGNLTLPMIKGRVQAALQMYFATLYPGDGVLVSRLVAAILTAEGVVDVAITTPAQNIAPNGLVWPRLGTLTLGAM